MSGEDSTLREQISETGSEIRGQAGQLNKDAIDAAREIHEEAQGSISDFNVEFETVKNGLQIRIDGKLSDLRSFQTEFEELIGDRGLNVTIETDFDVEFDSSLVIEMTSGSDPEDEGDDGQ